MQRHIDDILDNVEKYKGLDRKTYIFNLLKKYNMKNKLLILNCLIAELNYENEIYAKTLSFQKSNNSYSTKDTEKFLDFNKELVNEINSIILKLNKNINNFYAYEEERKYYPQLISNIDDKLKFRIEQIQTEVFINNKIFLIDDLKNDCINRIMTIKGKTNNKKKRKLSDSELEEIKKLKKVLDFLYIALRIENKISKMVLSSKEKEAVLTKEEEEILDNIENNSIVVIEDIDYYLRGLVFTITHKDISYESLFNSIDLLTDYIKEFGLSDEKLLMIINAIKKKNSDYEGKCVSYLNKISNLYRSYLSNENTLGLSKVELYNKLHDLMIYGDCCDLKEVKYLLDNYTDSYTLVNSNNISLFEELMEHFTNVLLNSKNESKITYLSSIIKEYMGFIDETNDETLKHSYVYYIDKIKTNAYESDIIDESRRDYIELRSNKLVNEEKVNIIKTLKEKAKFYKTERLCITLDSKNTKHCEQAISVNKTSNGYHMEIYVVDFCDFLVDNYEKLYERAVNNNDKIYIKRYSGYLRKRKENIVVTFSFNLDNNYYPIDFDIKRKSIDIKYKLAYEDMENVIDTTKDNHLASMLKNIIKIGENINQTGIHYNLNGVDKSMSEIMIFLKNFMAKKCYVDDVPFIYKKSKNTENIQLEENLLDMGINVDFQYINGFKYYTKNFIGKKEFKYGNVTAPVRSFSSALNQLFICNYYIDIKKYKEDLKDKINCELNEYCEEVNKIDIDKCKKIE